MFDLGCEAGPLITAPFGTNMAFQRRVFAEYGSFRTDLGPGTEIRSNEDSEFGHRLLAAGEQLKYEPTAVVYHAVPLNRLQKKYFLNWWFDKGCGEVRASYGTADTKYRITGIPLHVLRRIAVWTMRWLLSFNSANRFTHKLAVWLLAGKAAESYRLAKEIRSGRHPCER